MLNPAEQSSPMILGLHHVAVVVKDVEASARFYRGVFELPDLKRLTASISTNRGAWFQVGALELHLQERKADTPKTDQHIAFLTERLDEICARVAAQGGRVQEAGLIEGINKRCFVYDLDGNRIELLQRQKT